MGFFRRLFGICRTPGPADAGCWRVADGRIEIDLARAPELAEKGGAMRLEGQGLAQRVLVVHGEDGQYHALPNTCTHMGRRLDPLPGQARVECCSVGKSTYEYTGQRVAGSAKEGLTPLPLEQAEGKLIVSLE